MTKVEEEDGKHLEAWEMKDEHKNIFIKNLTWFICRLEYELLQTNNEAHSGCRI